MAKKISLTKNKKNFNFYLKNTIPKNKLLLKKYFVKQKFDEKNSCKKMFLQKILQKKKHNSIKNFRKKKVFRKKKLTRRIFVKNYEKKLR